jgi:ketosteroid isomerase-like protein
MTSRDQYDKLTAVYEGAHAAGDAEAIGRLFTEDALILFPGQPPVSGRQAIQDLYKKFLGEGIKIAVNAQDFYHSGDIAYGAGTFEAEDGAGNYLEVLHRQSDNSLLFHRMCFNSH